MATILLQAAGAAAGGLFGTAGAAVGSAAGAIAGYLIDQAWMGGARHVHGPRLAGPRPLAAEEGQPVPRLYGMARLGATLIWATRFEEESRTERQGGKGGTRLTSYSYYANVALALCEGDIAGVRRIWADGVELDREQVELRVYRGTADQLADPLIESRQGQGNAPAYRGIAYAVLERFPLEAYGNRIPQFQFEVLRPVGDFHRRIRAVALIPGCSEYGLSPQPVTRPASAWWGLPRQVDGTEEVLNRSVTFAASDLAASLDELQALCPALEHVALVVAWFGDDLRAGTCTLRPKIADAAAPEASRPWRVSGIGRGEAAEVTRHDGSPAYGGTPSDLSVMEAIAELKSRGLKVTLYPFVLMDIAEGNASGQPAYPWRGRIAGGADSDGTAAARAEVAAFCGAAGPDDFTAAAGTVDFAGDGWGYRRMILHYAHLARAAGGVDAFLVGSELRGLTTLRDGEAAYPFVGELVRLAADVRAVLGGATLLSYGADWSEYFGHQPQDGSGDLRFHLDALWASPDIDAVGIDNYFPLSDWRDGDWAGGNPDGAASPDDAAALRAAIRGGEGHDWYYASEADRLARLRTPIGDGGFRPKDLAGWWSGLHYERIGGVRQETPTGWVPCGKPIWFTELGCAAIDKGPNQPNQFGDPKSSESGRPFFSDGSRDDGVQRAFLAAHHAQWDPSHPGFAAAANPVSPAYGGRMVDPARIYHWCWDARPFPAFPLARDRWSDGGNWPCGHWLNGRVGAAAIADILQAILADHGLPAADVRQVRGTLTGLVLDRVESARASLESLCDLCGIAVSEAGGLVTFADEHAAPLAAIGIAECVAAEDGPSLTFRREPAQDVPGEVALHFRDPLRDYQQATVRAGDAVALSAGLADLSLPLVCETGRAEALAASWLVRRHAGRDRIVFSLPFAERSLQPGSVFRLAPAGGGTFLATRIEEGLLRRIEARRLSPLPPVGERPGLPGNARPEPLAAGPPLALWLDLPMLAGGEPLQQFRVAAWSKPWRGVIVSASPETSGFTQRATLSAPATIGVLETALAPGPGGRRDHAASLRLRLLEGELASVTYPQLLNGANALAVQCDNGGWEILQFELAEEIAASVWHLSGLLRAQAGTGDAMAAGAAAGNFAVLLDGAVVAAGLAASEIGLARYWRAQPAGLVASAASSAQAMVTGGLRALLPLSPVHLKAAAASAGGLDISWIRRGRIDADSWLGPDIPLGEERESWALRIRGDAGELLRQEFPTEARWHYPAPALAADRAASASLRLEVRQVSATAGEGPPAFLILP